MSNKLKKIILAIIFFGNALIITLFWYKTSGPLLVSSDMPSVLIALGRYMGLVAEFFILVQLTLIGRIRQVERLFGFDKLNRFHRIIGYTLACFIPLHPTLLILGYAMSGSVSLWSQFLDFLNHWEDVLWAFIGLLLLWSLVILSIAIIRRKLKYETWYFAHLFMYVAIFLIFLHQTNAGDMRNRSFFYYWYALNFTIFGLVLLYRFLRPLYMVYKHRFRVLKVVKENPDVTSVYISGRAMSDFIFEPGQYAHITFLAKGKWFTHPFSFSAAPNGEYIRLSIKGVGDFTRTVDQIKPGTKLIIDGPFGIFTERVAKTDKFLFIAGGIGITPIYSLIESLAPRKANMRLLYANQVPEHAVFLKDLSNMHVEITNIYSSKNVPGFEYGFVDEEKLKRLVPDFRERDIYVCGPPPMMKSVVKILKNLDVPNKQVHFERFGY